MNQMLPRFLRFLRHAYGIFPLAVLVMIASLFVLTPRVASAAASTQSNPEQTVLVHFEAGTPPEMRDALIAQMDGQLVTWMHQIDVAEVRLPTQEGASTASFSPMSLPLMANEMVTFAEADLVVSGMAVPNDPNLADSMMSYGLDHVQVLDAWDVITGSQEIVIAVVDSGVKLDHPEFAGRLVAGYDFINDDEQPDDDQGHGTHVAGIIAAMMNNGQGVAGICPNCQIMPVKVLNENNLGSWSHLAQGILFAVDQGAHVINLSLGANVPSETLAAAIEYAVEQGVVVTAAAGNFGTNELYYPASLPGVIAVGATDQNSARWSRSNFGSYVDLSAPGDMIYSTYHDLHNLYSGYTYMSGTSMSTAFVSGVAGLLLSLEPDLEAEQVTEAMILGADDLGVAGWDSDFGHGRVNAWGALLSPTVELAIEIGEIEIPENPSMGQEDSVQEGSARQDDVQIFLPALSNH